MLIILKSAHVILAAEKNFKLHYINNYINWDQYNTLYDENFLTNEIRARIKIVKIYS